MSVRRRNKMNATINPKLLIQNRTTVSHSKFCKNHFVPWRALYYLSIVLLAVSVLLCWFSTKYEIRFYFSPLDAMSYLEGGTLDIEWGTGRRPLPSSLEIIDTQLPHKLWFPKISNPFDVTGAALIPCWLPILLFAVTILVSYRKTRIKPRVGHCGGCGYNLRGVESGICPECGTQFRERMVHKTSSP